MTHQFWQPILNHLWQSSLFAAAAAILALSLRQHRAQVRYRVWLAASLKFLLPFSLLVEAGSNLGWRGVPPAAAPLSAAIVQASRPFEAAFEAAHFPAPAAPSTAIPAFLFLIWLCGAVGILARTFLRWRRVHAAVQASRPLPIEAPVAVRSSAARLEPGVFGVFRPVLLLPEGIADRLTPAQLRAILAHEFCHVRRRDNLAAAIHMGIEALFWFHPLVWWIGARLMEERERACDEEVLQQGAEPAEYAAGILSVCRFYLESPVACAAGVTGADLRERVSSIMSGRVCLGLSRTRRALLAAAGLIAVAGPLLIGMLEAPHARAQATPTLRFEVATIKPVKGAGGRGGVDILPGGGLRLDGLTLKSLVAFAYGVRETQISGGPKWIDSEAYNLLAKPEHPAPADNPSSPVAPGTTAWERMELRLRTLLAERFQLAIHKDAKETSGYALVTAKGGPKLTASPEGTGIPRTMRSHGRIDAQYGTMNMLANLLSNFTGRPVEDRSGLTGAYDYKVEYTQDPGPLSSEVANPGGPSLFDALQEQLGLKLEPARVKLETIVIDRAERPSAN